MTRLNRTIALSLVLSLLAASLIPFTAFAANPSSHPSPARTAATDDSATEQDGLRFRLSDAVEPPEAVPTSKTASATPLSAAEATEILKRLPPIKTDAGDQPDFSLREASLPPPRTGKTINADFPSRASEAPTKSLTGPLEVLRYAPSGDVELAANLSVTFSQPMVALSSQEDAASVVPIRLTPQPKGKWRWVGAKTLLFEPEGKFPMATRYSVTVPAGTRSATGNVLKEDNSWSFITAPPKLKTSYPNKAKPVRRDTLIFAEFDQQIDPVRVLQSTRVKTGGRQWPLRLATPAEIDTDKEIRSLVDHAHRDRWLVFRTLDAAGNAADALPTNAGIEVSFVAGLPSAEGSGVTRAAQSFDFQTLGPLHVTTQNCGLDKRCDPNEAWFISFSSALDAKSLEDSQVRVEPPIEDLGITSYGNSLHVSGEKRPGTEYRVILSGTLKDEFGQELGSDTTLQFKVGPAHPQLIGAGEDLVVLDPYGPPQFPVYSTNHNNLKVSIYSVTPADWPRWLAYNDEDEKQSAAPPGRLVYSKTITTRSRPDELVETLIDLTPALSGGFGQMVLIVEPAVKPVKDDYANRPIKRWIQRTEIGLDAIVDNTDLLGWATSLKDGKPLADVELSLEPYAIKKKSAADGTVALTLPREPAKPVPNLLVARRGRDLAILPEDMTDRGAWFRSKSLDELRWYVFDDRGLYRPGEEVHLKGWLRRIGGAKDGDVGLLSGAATSASFTVTDSQKNVVTKGTLPLNALGGFDSTIKLPSHMGLGFARVELKAEGGSGDLEELTYTHQLRVEEFRRPEFEVSAKNETEGPIFVGDHADTSVTAKYYAGGGLPNANVSWTVTSTAASFTPPNRDDFTFGKWVPWWERHYDSDSHVEKFSARTDAVGKHRLRIDFASVNPPRPSTVIAAADVTDLNRQVWASKTTLLVHPASLYVGLKTEKTFVDKGEPLVIQTIVTDLDGQAIVNREIQMRAVQLDWKQEKGEWKEVEVNPQQCSVQSAHEAVNCRFNAPVGGEYRVTASIRDDRERLNQSELTLWVAGGRQRPAEEADEDEVKLIPDRKEYRGGETASVLIQSPFYPAEGLMTLDRSGMVKSERFHLDGPTSTLRINIDEGWTPNIQLHVDLVGATDRDPLLAKGSREGVTDDSVKTKARREQPKQPAFASGEISLSIPPVSRKLNVTATPRDRALEPGAETVIKIETKDANGGAVSGSEVAVIVVDEAVLALTDYKLADPLAAFYTEREEGIETYRSRKDVIYAVPPGIGGGVGAGVGGATGGMRHLARRREYAMTPPNAAPTLALEAQEVAKSDTAVEKTPPILLRQNFNALAIFAPAVRTDSNGSAEVKVKLPDNLTRYRVMAVAVAGGKQFGLGESAITARLPLMARASAPRFLNYGDHFELPVMVQNQTDSAITVDVAVRASNAQLLTGTALVAGQRVTVPANDRVEVRFPATTTNAGTARFQIAAVSGAWADAAEVQLPVWTPATTESFATYGEIDEGAIAQPVKAPDNVFARYGGLEIETSSTQLQQLTDAFLYLQNYPYECSEQISSRILSVAALHDVLVAFKTKELPQPSQIEAAVDSDIKRLQGMQNDDGGFGFWKRGNESWPYLSIHVAHALTRASQKGFAVPPEMLTKVQAYLRQVEERIPSYYSENAKRALIAYALFVRGQMNDRDAARARRLIAEAKVENLSLESVGWLLSVLGDDKNSAGELTALRLSLNNRVSETAGAAHFTSSYLYDDYLLLNSERRADGIVLEALIRDQPQSDLIPKVVRGLLAHRTQGRWGNTQENVFILLALDRYFQTYEKVTPDFVARVWLGNAFAGEQQFKGRSTDRQQVHVPMSYLAEKSNANSGEPKQEVILSKTGAGRLYFRIGLNYAPVNLNLNPADYGFSVERTYEALDHAADVRRDADGTWHIKAGARVRVRVTMVAPSRRYHVALNDPLAAGFEILNPELAVTEAIPVDRPLLLTTDSWETRRNSWWRANWFDHQNLCDDRAEAFASLLREGIYNYSYVVRATTPGTFVVPPAKAEEMYQPETFGRSKTDQVVIE